MAEVPTVLLIHPPLILGAAEGGQPWFRSLALIALAGQLRACGAAVRLVDAFSRRGSGLYPYGPGTRLLGTPVPRLLAGVADGGPGGEAGAGPTVARPTLVVLPAPLSLDEPNYREWLRLVAGLRAGLANTPIVAADVAALGPPPAVRSGPVPGPQELGVDAFGPPARLSPLAWLASQLGLPAPTSAAAAAPPAWDLVPAADCAAFLVAVFDRRGLENPWRVAPDSRPLLTAHATAGGVAPLGLPAIAAAVETLRTTQRAAHLVILDACANAHPEFAATLDLYAQAGLAFDFANALDPARLTADLVRRLQGRVGRLPLRAAFGAAPALAGFTELVHAARQGGLGCDVHAALTDDDPRARNATLGEAAELSASTGARVLFHTPWRPANVPFEASLDAAPPRALGPGDEPLETALRMFALRQATANTRKVIINLTYRCNNHCAFCAVGNRLVRDAAEADVRRYLDTHYAAGVRLVDFDGGEPTLHPGHLRLIRHARALGYREINLTTNGRLLSYDTAAARLLRSGLTNLLISLHGPDAAAHEGLTAAPGSFAQTLGGIRNVLRLRPDTVGFGVNTTVVRPNLERLADLARLLQAAGVTHWTLQLLTPFGRARGEFVPDPERTTAVLSDILRQWAEPLGITVINAPFCTLPGFEKHVAQDVGKVGRDMIFVDREQVNLFAYLAERRRRVPACAACPYALVCGGVYHFDPADSDPIGPPLPAPDERP